MEQNEFLLEEASWPATLPAPHRSLLQSILRSLRSHANIVGVAAGGSFLSGCMDEFSDLDLIVAVEPAHFSGVQTRRKEIATSMGPLLAAFTGEHVGEPRLLICLFGPPLVHVDLKFLTPADLEKRVEDPIVLWDRTGEMRSGLAMGTAHYPQPDLQWLEDRFWIWVHYGATKIGRGELFEVLDFCAFLRSRVLGPLALQKAGTIPSGVRRIEQAAPEFATELQQAIANYERGDAIRAIRAIVELYRRLRDEKSDASLQRNADAENAAVAYLESVTNR